MSSNHSNIASIAVHQVGNKASESLKLSLSNLSISDSIQKILNIYFISPFKFSEYFNFYHDIDMSMNEVFVCVSRILDNPDNLLAQSVNLAKHL
jgi:hypothetical protein